MISLTTTVITITTPPTTQRNRKLRRISCNHKHDNATYVDNVNRRNVLLSLGGLYGATTTTTAPGLSAAQTTATDHPGGPVQPPDLTKCHLATDAALQNQVYCCPPYSVETTTQIYDFKLPDPSEPMRTRRPAHDYGQQNLEKYKAALTAMKGLPLDHPWNFFQQAQIHCAYCQGAYGQVGYPDVDIQVHQSFLFPPWHRFYMYFWERILGKLINDPTFALPFWQWDDPVGMQFPDIYLDPNSPLYDVHRNLNHYKTLMDFRYARGDPNPNSSDYPKIEGMNLHLINRIFREGLRTPSTFMGEPVVAGQVPRCPGQLQLLHDTIHQWSGPETSPFWDMGNFNTAARDPIFFGHHANVDRMWHLYRNFNGGNVEFKTKDWLDATFLFVDENNRVVSDSLDAEKMRYTYETEQLKWWNIPKSSTRSTKKTEEALSAKSVVPVFPFGPSARVLNTTIRALVSRPMPSRSNKDPVSEVLIIDDIRIGDEQQPVRFDVYVAKPIDGNKADLSDLGEFAGSYVRVPHGHGHGNATAYPQHCLLIGITCLIEDINAEGCESLIVSMVPRTGDITIGTVEIQLFNDAE
ncbi:hypothetical protein Sjap_002619 [Stephania japonica]|uniref:Tyrosinase copper-binding domain-containing protein n=1 Tax=Stephania japonica TaxID=461633 RepID=A0AAP0PUP6_9MAGN